MARTKQTARKRAYEDEEEFDAEEQNEINSKLTDEDKARRAELEKMPMQAEVKHLEKRWTKKGKCYVTEPKDDDDIPEQAINWYEKFALCITRQYDGQNKYVQRTSLQINSKPLKDILKDVIGDYPGQSFLTSNVAVDFEPHCLYHYRTELLEKLETLAQDSDGASHLQLLLKIMDEHFEETLADTKNFAEQGLISYEHLWTLFRPNVKVFTRVRGQPRVYKLNSYAYQYGNCPHLSLSISFIDYDGEDFGVRNTSLAIPKFSGAQAITTLNAFPLSRHPSALQISRTLIARGKKWETINATGQSFMDYKGVAVDTECPPHRYNIESRVMIDASTFHRIEADEAFTVNALPLTEAQKAKATLLANDPFVTSMTNGDADILIVDREPLTDEQCMLATPIMRGFSFTEKLFLEFFVDLLSPIEWNESCFEQLVLPSSQKELVQALVAEHTQRNANVRGGNEKGNFDDIVKNKGLGLILVLHGPPGVGKTLTAECVAEFSKTPLYIVSSGDLGTNSSALDTRLSRILDLASTWRAVLLIDEADVFLERRSLNDMERNSLVSIFLRTLEYYSGILFMTTNRVQTFDDAFKSRIHVPLKYNDLPKSSRVKIWKNFVDKVRKDESGVDVEMADADFDALAESHLNGRQIKNVVRTAKSLVGYRGGKLDLDALNKVVEIQTAFEEDLTKAEGAIDEVEK